MGTFTTIAMTILWNGASTLLRRFSARRQSDVPIVSDIRDYNGFLTKAARLRLKPLVEEVVSIVTGFRLLVAEEKQANGTKWIRQQIDRGFAGVPGWVKIA